MQLCFVLVTNEYTFFNPPSRNTLVWESGWAPNSQNLCFPSLRLWLYFGSLGSQGGNAFTKGPNSVSTELGVETTTDHIWLVSWGLMPVGLKLVSSRHGMS